MRRTWTQRHRGERKNIHKENSKKNYKKNGTNVRKQNLTIASTKGRKKANNRA